MGGAKNCPETPRQKMIGMMYLVLTAMLALNVSTDILNGFTLVGNSIRNQKDNVIKQATYLYGEIENDYKDNPIKVKEWLDKATEVKAESDKLYDLLEEFRVGIINIADGKDARPDTIQKRDHLDAGGQFAQLANGGAKGNELETALKNYRAFVEKMFDSDPDRIAFYEKTFNTNPDINGHGESVDWVTATFESMPAVAVVTMLEKYQSDVRSAEAELYAYFRKQTDIGDFRVNKITAMVIPNSKHVIQGGTYHADIALMAIDSTKTPVYYLNGNKLDTGVVDIRCGTIGKFPIKGYIELTNPAGEVQRYDFEDEYTVGAPTATVANVDMNVVYRGYNNRMEISVPGVASERLKVNATGATLTKDGKYYICKPSATDKVVITIAAEVEGKTQTMGSSEFRVKPLPSPTAFLKVNGNDWRPGDNAGKVSRPDLLNASVIAQYEDGMLNANFTVTEFTLSVSDGRGGFNSTKSSGNKFSDSQRATLSKLKPGVKVILENIKYTGPKSGTLPFPTITLP